MPPVSARRTIVEGRTRPQLAACPTNEDDHFTDETSPGSPPNRTRIEHNNSARDEKPQVKGLMRTLVGTPQ